MHASGESRDTPRTRDYSPEIFSPYPGAQNRVAPWPCLRDHKRDVEAFWRRRTDLALPEGMRDGELEATLHANRHGKWGNPPPSGPDWPAIHRELEQARDAAEPSGTNRSPPIQARAAMRWTHAAGERLLVDYAGDSVPVLVGRATGKMRLGKLDADAFAIGSSPCTRLRGDRRRSQLRVP